MAGEELLHQLLITAVLAHFLQCLIEAVQQRQLRRGFVDGQISGFAGQDGRRHRQVGIGAVLQPGVHRLLYRQHCVQIAALQQQKVLAVRIALIGNETLVGARAVELVAVAPARHHADALIVEVRQASELDRVLAEIDHHDVLLIKRQTEVIALLSVDGFVDAGGRHRAAVQFEQRAAPRQSPKYVGNAGFVANGADQPRVEAADPLVLLVHERRRVGVHRYGQGFRVLSAAGPGQASAEQQQGQAEAADASSHRGESGAC